MTVSNSYNKCMQLNIYDQFIIQAIDQAYSNLLCFVAGFTSGIIGVFYVKVGTGAIRSFDKDVQITISID